MQTLNHDFVTIVEKTLEAEPRQEWNTAVYDTALLLLSDPDFIGETERTALLERLIESQDVLGHWGDPTISPHCALVDTLGMLYTLCSLENGPTQFQQIIEKGWDAVNVLLRDSSAHIFPGHEPVGFELIAPSLIEIVVMRRQGFTEAPTRAQIRERLNEEAFVFYERLKDEQEKKESLMLQLNLEQNGCRRLFFPGTTTEHSAEALLFLHELGEHRKIANDVDHVHELINPNIGGIGLAPGATAAIKRLYMLREMQPPEELDAYLLLTFQTHGREGVPNLFPISNTSFMWPFIPMLLAGDMEFMQQPEIVSLLQSFFAQLQVTRTGVSWDRNNPLLADLDDTALAITLNWILRALDVPTQHIDFRLFERFQYNDGAYFCFPGELTPSPSHVLHTLMALDLMQKLAPRDVTDTSVFRQLHDNAIRQAAFILGAEPGLAREDKWHLLDGYTLSRILSSESLLTANPHLVHAILRSALQMQNADGGFGTSFHPGSLDEQTIYNWMGLINFRQMLRGTTELAQLFAYLADAIDFSIQAATTRIRQYIGDREEDAWDFPRRTWQDKGLYTPKTINQGLIIAAKHYMAKLEG